MERALDANGIAPPEPDLTPEEVIRRAEALVPTLVERQAETEALTYYPESTHQDFIEAGFYRMLVPKRFGGYEFDYPTFVRVVVALSSGCPSTGWCFCLPAGHSLLAGGWFDEQAQAELFGTGHFLCAAVADPSPIARRTDDGWIVSGRQAYGSGSPYSTHFMGQATVPDEEGADPRGRSLLFIAPRSEWKRLDDWGHTLGLRGSGSHTVVLEDARIPAQFALEDVWMIEVDVTGGTPGSRLHGNPMYAGRTVGWFQTEIAAIMVGAAKGALAEYERMLRTRMTTRPPIVPRAHDPLYQRWFGTAMGRVAAAEAALIQSAEQYMELCRRGVEDGIPFSRMDDLRLHGVARQAMVLAWDAMQSVIFRTAGTSAARTGERMERTFRDMAMGWTHFTNVLSDWVAIELAKEHFGIADADA